MTETLIGTLTGLDPAYQVVLILATLWLAGYIVSQLVALVRVVLDRETIDSDDTDPQLAEVIDRLDSLCEYAHDTFGVLDEWQRDGSARDDHLAANVADIADGIRAWRQASLDAFGPAPACDATASRRDALKLDLIRLGDQP